MKILSNTVSRMRSACVKVALCLIPFLIVSAPASATTLTMDNISNPVVAGGRLTGTSNFGLVGSTLGFDLTIGESGTPAQVFVAAYIPAGSLGLPVDTWFCLTQSNGWQPLNGTYVPVLTGLTTGTVLRVSLISGVDLASLPKAEVYVGYGTSATEMIQAARYKAVVAVR